MVKISRNAPCPCGSGKKYKKCCLQKDQEASSQAYPSGDVKTLSQLDSAVEPFNEVYSAEEGDMLEKLSNSVVDLIEDGKLDEAEKVSLQLLDQYPNQVDGLFSLGMVYEARGENGKAAEYYRKAADFTQTMPGFDESTTDWIIEKAIRMESSSNE